MSRKIRVLHLITGLGVGGAEKLLLSIIRKSDRERFEISVCCLYNKGYIAEKIEELGVPVYCLDMKSFFDPAALRQLFEFLKAQKPDILHTHLFRANIWGRVFGAFAFIPAIISSEHSLTKHFFEGRKRTFWLNSIDTLSSIANYKIIAVSNSTKRCLVENGVPSSKVEVIFNAVDLEEFESIAEDPLFIKRSLGFQQGDQLVAVVGRLYPQKGHSVLLHAFDEVVRSCPSAKLLVAGDGPLRESLQQLASTLKFPDAVIFMGVRNDIGRILRASDIVVGPSLFEPFGIAFVEAMLSRKPVIASNVDGIPDVVDDNITGILVPPGDPDSLAIAILKLMNDPVTAQAMGEAGYLRAKKHFVIDQAVRQLETLYAQAAKDRLKVSF